MFCFFLSSLWARPFDVNCFFVETESQIKWAALKCLTLELRLRKCPRFDTVLQSAVGALSEKQRNQAVSKLSFNDVSDRSPTNVEVVVNEDAVD